MKRHQTTIGAAALALAAAAAFALFPHAGHVQAALPRAVAAQMTTSSALSSVRSHPAVSSQLRSSSLTARQRTTRNRGTLRDSHAIYRGTYLAASRAYSGHTTWSTTTRYNGASTGYAANRTTTGHTCTHGGATG
ncbi:MAG: hypothetical protein M3Z66_04255 [Chloroflexota bacterium]|nr:hypothetical protein [Chloroflexota bacterium]